MPLMTPHGFHLLNTTGDPSQPVYRQLREAGYAPWDGTGRPRFVVLYAGNNKPSWFEAGFWAGAGIPLFLLGKGSSFRRKHRETVERLGGWLATADGHRELIAALHRRQILPDEWDRVVGATLTTQEPS